MIQEHHPPSHPFPYFDLLVTRNPNVIKRAVEEKFKKVTPFAMKMPEEVRKFNKYAMLIAILDTKSYGKYEANLAGVEEIIKKCLPDLEALFQDKVAWNKTIHRNGYDKGIETAEKVWRFEPALTRSFFDEWMKQQGITFRTDEATPLPPAEPVSRLVADNLPNQVRLRWNLPSRCDGILIARSIAVTPTPADKVMKSDKPIAEWIDTNVEPGQTYHYAVFSIVGTQPPTVHQSVSLRARGKVEDLKVVAKGIRAKMSWKLPPHTEKVIVFRAQAMLANLVDNTGELSLPTHAQKLRELDAATEYEDTSVFPGQSYHYAIVAKHGAHCYSVSESQMVTLGKPLAPPQIARAVSFPGRILLTWQAPAGPSMANVQYVITRCESPDGSNPAANTTIFQSRGLAMEDKSAIAGTTYWYFVAAIADGVESARVMAQPVTAFSEVTGLKAKALPWSAELTWQTPPKAKRVEVRRCDGEVPPPVVTGMPPPAGTTLVPVVWPDTLTDQGLAGDKTYGYRVSCVFVDPDGKEIATPGEGCTVKPTVPPPLTLTVKPDGRKAVLEWNLLPDTQRVLIVRSAAPIEKLLDAHGQFKPASRTQILKELEPVTRYEDDQVVLEQVYFYVVLVRLSSSTYWASECRAVSIGKAPPHVAGIKTHNVPGKIYLSWLPVEGYGNAEYRIVRTQARDPQDSAAKPKVFKKSKTTFEDHAIVPGRSYWYAVFCRANGLESLGVRVGPVLATAEVTDLRAREEDQQVTLSWKAPPGAQRVEVRRRVAEVPPPPDQPLPASVVRVPANKAGKAVDNGLTNETTYGYRVFCVYKGLDGKEVQTRGEAVLATPCTPPPRIMNVRGRAEPDTGIRLTWVNPQCAQVVVIRCKSVPTFEIDHTQPIADLESLGHRLASVEESEVIDGHPRHDEPVYLVFSANRFLAAFAGMVCMVELVNVSAKSEPGRFRLDWNWPEGCIAIRVFHMKNGVKSVSKRVRRESNATTGSITWSGSELGRREQTFLLICEVNPEDPQLVPGSGIIVAAPSCGNHLIEYEVVPAGWFGAAKLTVRTDGDLVDLEAIRLVGKTGALPTGPEDGRCLLEWEPTGSDFSPLRTMSLDIKTRPTNGEMLCRLYIVPSDGAVIKHPPVEKSILR